MSSNLADKELKALAFQILVKNFQHQLQQPSNQDWGTLKKLAEIIEPHFEESIFPKIDPLDAKATQIIPYLQEVLKLLNYGAKVAATEGWGETEIPLPEKNWPALPSRPIDRQIDEIWRGAP